MAKFLDVHPSNLSTVDNNQTVYSPISVSSLELCTNCAGLAGNSVPHTSNCAQTSSDNALF